MHFIFLLSSIYVSVLINYSCLKERESELMAALHIMSWEDSMVNLITTCRFTQKPGRKKLLLLPCLQILQSKYFRVGFNGSQRDILKIIKKELSYRLEKKLCLVLYNSFCERERERKVKTEKPRFYFPNKWDEIKREFFFSRENLICTKKCFWLWCNFLFLFTTSSFFGKKAIIFISVGSFCIFFWVSFFYTYALLLTSCFNRDTKISL